MATDPLINPELAEFLQAGISMHVASRDAQNLACIARAIGCRISPDFRHITVFVRASQCQPLLADFSATGAIAFVASEPSTHRTVQLKGGDATIALIEPEDLARIDRQCAAFSAGLALLGYDPGLGPTLLGGEHDDVAAVTFTPTSAFQQTPGPCAGDPLVAR